MPLLKASLQRRVSVRHPQITFEALVMSVSSVLTKPWSTTCFNAGFDLDSKLDIFLTKKKIGYSKSI